MIYNSVIDLVGNTPLMRLKKYEKQHALGARVLAKLEYFNPAGSVKDRVARAMLEEAVRSGALKEGGTIIEPTSGNTGIALAALGSALGVRVILTMPETMSVERRKLIELYGAEVVLTDGAEGMRGATERAARLAAKLGGVVLGQFTNPANPKAHFDTTGVEIYKDTDGAVDIFVSGVGTGGTVTGAGGYLKSVNPEIRVVAVEPSGSPYLSKGVAGKHKIQGIGAGFKPEILDCGIFDEIITVDDETAYQTAREIARIEGIGAGISSGAALAAATVLARRSENSGKTIVIIFPDGSDRYLSVL